MFLVSCPSLVIDKNKQTKQKCLLQMSNVVNQEKACNQGRSDGGYISIYTPTHLYPHQVIFMGKNDVRMAIQQFYTPKNFCTPQNKFLATPCMQ